MISWTEEILKTDSSRILLYYINHSNFVDFTLLNQDNKFETKVLVEYWINRRKINMITHFP